MTDATTQPIDLDDPGTHTHLDTADMHGDIMGFPDQLRRSLEAVADLGLDSIGQQGFSGICVCGMGGSAIGGDLVRALLLRTLPIPLIVNRNYRLPEFVDDTWLVIASSYSGNTEEVLAAAAEAVERECPIIAIATGGKVGKHALKHGWPLLAPGPDLQPRAALGYSFALLLLVLERLHLAPQTSADIAAAAAFLEERAAGLTRDVPESDNPAKQAARDMFGRILTVYGGADLTDAVALRVKGQVNENAKAHAFANICPEYNHNEIEGWNGCAAMADKFAAIQLLSPVDEHTQIGRRQHLVRGILGDCNIPVLEWTAEGDTPMQRMLSLVQLGDFATYYLAILKGIDPTPVEALEYLKAKLSS